MPVAASGPTPARAVVAPSIPAPLIEPIPLTVRVCLAPELMNAHLHRAKHVARLDAVDAAAGTDRLELGAALASTVERSVELAFASVTVEVACVPDRDPGNGPPRLSAKVTEVEVLIPPLVNQKQTMLSWSSTIVVALSLSTTDEPPVDWQVTGAGEIPYAPLHGDQTPESLSAALRSLSAHLLASFYLEPSVRDWLGRRGAAAVLPE